MGVVRMSTINGCLEREGLARLTISILVITTAGCLAYTWGYAEGVHNSHTIIVPSHTAAPVILHATEVKLAGSSLANNDVISSMDNNTIAVHPAKRIHTRRRARKNPPDNPILPGEAYSEQQAAAQQATADSLTTTAAATGSPEAAGTSADDSSIQASDHARLLLTSQHQSSTALKSSRLIAVRQAVANGAAQQQ